MEMSCTEDLANRLHQGVADNDGDIGSRVAIGLFSELAVILAGQLAWSRADIELEHPSPRFHVRQRNVDALLESEKKSQPSSPS